MASKKKTAKKKKAKAKKTKAPKKKKAAATTQPEEVAPEPVAAPAPPQETERQRARRERKERQQHEAPARGVREHNDAMRQKAETEAKAEAALEQPAVGASVTSINDAKAKRKKIEDAQAKVKEELDKSKELGTDEGEIAYDLDDLNSYKLLHLNDKKRRAEEAVRSPILKAFQAKLDAQINQLRQADQLEMVKAQAEALKESREVAAATKEHAEAVNEVLDLMAPQLPVGYAVAKMEPENKKVLATWNPPLVGKKMEVPGT